MLPEAERDVLVRDPLDVERERIGEHLLVTRGLVPVDRIVGAQPHAPRGITRPAAHVRQLKPAGAIERLSASSRAGPPGLWDAKAPRATESRNQPVSEPSLPLPSSSFACLMTWKLSSSLTSMWRPLSTMTSTL